MDTSVSRLVRGLVAAVSIGWAMTICGLPVGAAEEPAIKKPIHDHPQTYEELVRDPKYKDARLLIPAQTPLADIPRWEEHKRAMHLKALKRSDLDHPDLRREVRRLLLATSGPNADERESSFQELDESLTIFRFTNFNSFIKKGAEKKAVALGKAFFWDVRFSSDQKVACASCHYAAGTDHRTQATVTLPVNFGFHMPWPDPHQRPLTGAIRPYGLSAKDLVSAGAELELDADLGVFDPESLGGFKTREVIGSIGIARRALKSSASDQEFGDASGGQLEPGAVIDSRLKLLLERVDTIESTYRQVTQRNSATVINAVFNARNFHDSRADTIFNGRTGWGRHDLAEINNSLFVLQNRAGTLRRIFTWDPADPHTPDKLNPYFIANAALASQAVEPIISDVEMSYRGRMFHHLARRMLGKRILDGQSIASDDSSLAPYANQRITYEQLIKEVFVDEWWNHPGKSVKLPSKPLGGSAGPLAADESYSQMEANFSLFWGLAIQIYESTLISDDSPFDREQRAAATSQLAREREAGKPPSLLSDAALRGLNVFRNVGCAECHSGADFTSASFAEIGLLGRDGQPRFPEPLDEDGDIALGEEYCPTEPPVGVECMNVNGRFSSLYDSGNYVLGISRFERRPSFPDAPPVRDGQLVTNLLFPANAAHWEDSGNGAEFVPPEEQPVGALPYRSVSELQRARFADHLLAQPNEIERLMTLLGIDLNVFRKVVEASAPPPSELAVEPTAAKARVKTAADGEPPLTAPQTASRLGHGNPLNDTQQSLRLTPDGDEIGLQKQIEKRREVPPAEPQPATNVLGLIRVEFSGQQETLVTHHTPVPLRSIARAFLPSWERDLRARQVAGIENPSEKIADAGAFKTPTLRNIELTGPYMHNGSLLTLDAVVEFYNRGGDFNERVVANQDDIRTGHKHPEMVPLELSPEQKSDLVEFLKSLTDPRVRKRSGPFDHPSLPLIVEIEVNADGQPVMSTEKTVIYRTQTLPEVGRNGGKELSTFESILQEDRHY